MVQNLFSTSGIKRASNKNEITANFYHKMLLFQIAKSPVPKERRSLVLMSLSLPKDYFYLLDKLTC